MTIIPFSKLGFAKLKQELETTIAKRPLAVESLKRGREMGDLSENGLYKAAKMELGDIDRQIRHLKNLVQYGRVFEPSDNNNVEMGHKVLIKSENGNREFLIVGEYEANPSEGKISIKSPIGQLLMGKKVGEKITFNNNVYIVTKITL
jgi:transcription elongation factor GreA